MMKFIGQLVLVIFATHIAPLDATMLELQANMPESEILDQAHFDPLVEMSFSVASLPAANSRIIYPVKADASSFGAIVSAQSAVVVDDASGMVLYAKHPDQIRTIGSVTKLMSALVFLDQDPNLNEYVKLDSELDLVEGGRIYLNFNDGLRLHDVLAASMVGSDNSATESFARFSGLSQEEFIAQMNQKALELKMEESYFVDATGIDSGNVSTARDLVLLLRAAGENEILTDLMQKSKITISQSSGISVNINNTNKLFDGYLDSEPYSIEAGKTGYLPLAGYVLAVTVEHEGDRIHVIVLGSESKETRIDDVEALAHWTYKTFSWPEIAE